MFIPRVKDRAYRHESMLNMEFSIKLPESLIVELSVIMSDDDMESELADDRLLESF